MSIIKSFGVVTKGNGDAFIAEESHGTLSTGGGQAGQGYACVLCINDQGGASISIERGNAAPTLRAQDHGHPPLIFKDKYREDINDR